MHEFLTGLEEGADAESMWVGRDEHEGVRAQARKDVKPPPHWRLEAIAQTPRPHSLTRRAAAAARSSSRPRPRPPMSGCSTSRATARPQRLTTGREPVALLG